MKPEKQRIAIAEVCGYSRQEPDSSWFDSPNEGQIYIEDLPEYLNDRNAIIEAVRSLPKDRLVYVLRFLQIIVTDDPENSMNEKALATPKQWSEAFLRGVGRWEECDHDSGYEFNGVGMWICNTCRADITPETQTK